MTTEKTIPLPETPLVNEMRLNGRQWIATLGIVLLFVLATPAAWQKMERFDTGPDYRIPYDLSKDYWLFTRWLRDSASPDRITVLGDSVVWGEYVLPDGTLPHFLGKASGQSDRFVNAGVNGLFPLALEGLVRSYGGPIRHRKVLLHCNLLWMSSPKVDLQVQKEEKFNHPRLVAQFSPRIPCYKADVAERLGIIIERNVNFLAWVNHLQNAYFGQKSILDWTLTDDGSNPPAYPNAYRNPLTQIALTVPSAPKEDPKRGPQSERHKPWSASGAAVTQFEWVTLESSLQWGAFQRLTSVLRERGNDVLVVIGPFNEHMMSPDNKVRFRKLQGDVAAALARSGVGYIIPETLPSTSYADASHPLTEGYELLARQLLENEKFQAWLK